MSDLSMFFAENVMKEEHIKYVASKRFLGTNGKPMEWEICCITSEEDEQLRRDSTKKIPIPGKRGQYTRETDYDIYLGKLGVKCVTFPNLNNVEFQNSYGVMGAEALLKTMLRPGEYSDLIAKVQEINGFNETFDEIVDEAKN